MQSELGRPVCGGELYAAHFLGADAACKLIRASESTPGASAASLFPQAASANRSVFFHEGGKPKSVREVYDWAMQQPGGSAPVSERAQPLTKPAALAQAAGAVDANIETLLAGVLNWQPQGFFSASQAGAGLNAPLQLSSGLLDIFSAANDT